MEEKYYPLEVVTDENGDMQVSILIDDTIKLPIRAGEEYYVLFREEPIVCTAELIRVRNRVICFFVTLNDGNIYFKANDKLLIKKSYQSKKISNLRKSIQKILTLIERENSHNLQKRNQLERELFAFRKALDDQMNNPVTI